MTTQPLSDNEFLFTSESVTEGHPDKMADQISDGVLDAVLREDPTGRGIGRIRRHGFRIVRLSDGAEATFYGDDSCERFRDHFHGDDNLEGVAFEHFGQGAFSTSAGPATRCT